MTFGGETQQVDIVIVPELSSLTVKIADAAQRVTKTETGYKLDRPTPPPPSPSPPSRPSRRTP